MKSDKLAKKLLSGEVAPEFAWIYELTNGIIKEENRGLEVMLNNETSIRGFDLRIIRPNQLVTMDFQLKRINVEVGYDGEITKVYLGWQREKLKRIK